MIKFLKKIICTFTIIDIILLSVIGMRINRNLIPESEWIGTPVYINTNNIINCFKSPENFKKALFDEQVKNTAVNLVKNTRGFNYFLSSDFIEAKKKVYKSSSIASNQYTDFISTITWEYDKNVNFAFIDKVTGDVIGSDIQVAIELEKIKNKNTANILKTVDTINQHEYIQIYDNSEQEGPYAENAILTDENQNYIEVYYQGDSYYEDVVYKFKRRIFKTIILLFLMLILLIKNTILVIKYGIKGTFKRNGDILRSIFKGRMANSIYLGFTSGVREKNYLVFLIIGTIGNIFIFYNFSYITSYYVFGILNMDKKAIIVFCIVQFIMLIMYRDKIYYIKTLKELECINEENLHYEMNELAPEHISEIVKEINLISTGYSKAVSERMKNNKLKTELISNVSHDLKTPLTSIINYIQIVQREDITEEEKEDFLKIVATKSKRLKSLIDDLFEAAKLEDNEINLDMHIIDVVELINQVIGEYSDNLEAKKLKVNIKCNKDEIKMPLDANKISRVFANIINNICKYAKEDTQVSIIINKKKSELNISFENCACYKMEFDEEEIFERFARGDKSRNSKIEGSGLGLAISKNIIKLHGGNMAIRKDENKFKIIITL